MTNQNTNEISLMQETAVTVVPTTSSVITGESYVINQNPTTGKFERKMVYGSLSTVEAPKTQKEMFEMLAILNGDDDSTAIPFQKAVGTIIDVHSVIFKPYDKVNPETGLMEYGVLVYLFDVSNKVYVTSSKSTYMTLKNYFVVTGIPNTPNYLGMKVEIIEKKGRDYDYKDVKIVH